MTPQTMTSHPTHQICIIQEHNCSHNVSANDSKLDICRLHFLHFILTHQKTPILTFIQLFFFNYEVTVDVVWATSCVDVSILLLRYLMRFPCDLWNAIPVWAYPC